MTDKNEAAAKKQYSNCYYKGHLCGAINVDDDSKTVSSIAWTSASTVNSLSTANVGPPASSITTTATVSNVPAPGRYILPHLRTKFSATTDELQFTNRCLKLAALCQSNIIIWKERIFLLNVTKHYRTELLKKWS